MVGFFLNQEKLKNWLQQIKNVTDSAMSANGFICLKFQLKYTAFSTDCGPSPQFFHPKMSSEFPPVNFSDIGKSIHGKFGRRKNLPPETYHLKPRILIHWEIYTLC